MIFVWCKRIICEFGYDHANITAFDLKTKKLLKIIIWIRVKNEVMINYDNFNEVNIDKRHSRSVNSTENQY